MNPPAPQLLKEAAEWLLALNFDDTDEAQRQAFERWRAQSEAHRAAWARAERVMGTFASVPLDIGQQALRRAGARALSRRRTLRLLTALLVGAPSGWLALRTLPWDAPGAELTTAIGERRSLVLADGSQLVLNSDSALDVRFDEGIRRLHLRRGEVLVTTHADPVVPRRPFVVSLAQGEVEALGTRFSVRRDEGLCQVAVFAHGVELRPQRGTAVRLTAGQQAWFDALGVQRRALVDEDASLWTRGMLVAHDRPLAEVLAELGRYRPGLLRCDPAVAGLRVSGALSLDDTDQALLALQRTLPIRVSRRTRYWVAVGAP
ncbi:MAG: iron dicitrate transport regulator FecR [Pseudomonas sp. PGPPP4]|uniref:FecR domain-containing protein n=1 Tax=Pseudomonas sp. PGPPP4 TaxID=2015556 RepID=UPI000BD9CF45|nr:FecR domain-containing protein [Pseudomonas sp. PGPPP4]OYT83832.1 MAG: iron dicitrate transport regulator FecR [Pseudomonas sp. PGPPP4]